MLPPLRRLRAWLVGTLLDRSGRLVMLAFLFAGINDAAYAQAGNTVNRSILAIFDSREEGPAIQSRLHKYAEMPLNYLGYQITLVDINQGLPGLGQMTGYRAVLTWFKDVVPDQQAYLEWTIGNIAAGRKLIVLGQPGLDHAKTRNGRAAVLRAFGLEEAGHWNAVTFDASVHMVDGKLLNFEAIATQEIPAYVSTNLISSQATPMLQIKRRTAHGEDEISTVASYGATGGYVADGFVMRAYKSVNRVRWVLNPFAFFRKALGGGEFPIPDVTTIAGRRLYFSHIDGDGWNNVSEIERYRTKSILSSDVVYRELIEPFPDLPVTVGLIAGDVDKTMGGRRRSAFIARKLFALSQVEVGSHSHTHPFNWNYFKDYARPAEVALIDRSQRGTGSRSLRTARAFGLDSLLTSSGRDRFTSGSDDLPRTYMQQPFDLETEIVGSLQAAEALAPAGKKAKLFQWSGDTTPFEGAIAAVRRAGVYNINGGDSRFDAAYPSVAYVPPIGRAVGSERQIYAVNSNENTYTQDWTGNHYGQTLLEQTLRNTQSPRRLKGFNLYYHMYTGERAAALRAVQRLLQRARRAPLVPIHASQYAAIADSFYGVRIKKMGGTRWRIENRKALNTFRFDRPRKRVVDLRASVGVLGYRRTNGALYVAIDGAARPAEIALAKSTGRQLPYLEESRWQVSHLVRRKCQWRMQATGFGASEMIWQAFPRRGYRVQVSRQGRPLWQADVEPDANGRTVINAPVDARDPLEISITCA
ncbi:MAG: polysaccharide deacetylase family protein [Hyphomicrobiaceae bacterium]